MENTKKTGIRALAWVLACALIALSIPLFTIVPNVTASAEAEADGDHGDHVTVGNTKYYYTQSVVLGTNVVAEHTYHELSQEAKTAIKDPNAKLYLDISATGAGSGMYFTLLTTGEAAATNLSLTMDVSKYIADVNHTATLGWYETGCTLANTTMTVTAKVIIVTSTAPNTGSEEPTIPPTEPTEPSASETEPTQPSQPSGGDDLCRVTYSGTYAKDKYNSSPISGLPLDQAFPKGSTVSFRVIYQDGLYTPPTQEKARGYATATANGSPLSVSAVQVGQRNEPITLIYTFVINQNTEIVVTSTQENFLVPTVTAADLVVDSWNADLAYGGEYSWLNTDTLQGTRNGVSGVEWGTFSQDVRNELTDDRYAEIEYTGNFSSFETGKTELRDYLWVGAQPWSNPVVLNSSQVLFRIDGPKNNPPTQRQLSLRHTKGSVTGNLHITITIYEDGSLYPAPSDDTPYAVTVQDGTGTAMVDGVEVTEAKAGETVTLTAIAPTDGNTYAFKEWVFDGATPNGFTVVNAETGEATFTMPSSAVTVKATFNKVLPAGTNLIVNGNFSDGANGWTISSSSRAKVENEKLVLNYTGEDAKDVTATASFLPDAGVLGAGKTYTLRFELSDDAKNVLVKIHNNHGDNGYTTYSTSGTYTFTTAENVVSEGGATYKETFEIKVIAEKSVAFNGVFDNFMLVEGTSIPEATDKPAEVEGTKYSAALTLNESIDINLKITGAAEGFAPAKVSVFVDGTALNANAIAVAGKVITAKVASVQPDKMANVLKIQITYDGVAVKNIDYSIRKYCESVFNAYKDTTDHPLYKLCKAVLHYGALVDKYVQELNNVANPTSTIDDGITAFAPASVTVVPKDVLPAKGDGCFSKAGCNLELGSTITMYFHIKLNDGKTIATTNPTDPEGEGTFVILSSNNTLVDEENITVSAYTGTDTTNGYTHTIAIKNISASKLSRTYTLMFWDDVKAQGVETVDQVASSVTYGVYNYCAYVQGNDNYSQILQNLCKAMFAYGEAAYAYAESPKSVA